LSPNRPNAFPQADVYEVIEQLAAEGGFCFLIVQAAIFQGFSKDSFEPRERSSHEAATMNPSFASRYVAETANLPQGFVAQQESLTSR
jgi:hypothetical protein